MKKTCVAVLGTGTWGLTLGLLLSRKGNTVRFWDSSPEYIKILARARENKKSLPGVRIPKKVLITDNMEKATAGAAVLLIVSP